MKKMLATLLATLMLLTMIPLGAVSVSALTSGNFTYTVSGGKATITDCDTSVSGALTIPSTISGYPVVAIGYEAFYRCSDITSVTIPTSVTTIEDRAFCLCYKLSSVTIPASVTSIGAGVFGHCTKLTAITVDKANPNYCDVDGVVLSKARTELVAFPTGRTGSYTVPSGVTTIKKNSFSGANITSVTISSGVTTVEGFAFSGSTDMTSVTISKSVKTIGYHAFYLCANLATVYYTGSSADRSKMTIDSNNTELTGAKWQYNAHVYSSVCDTTCDECSATRVAPHDYVATCDPVCDECGQTRQVSADAHTYSNACDAECNQCGWIREVSADVHTYTNACDATCNSCGAERKAPHSFATPESINCTICGMYIIGTADALYQFAATVNAGSRTIRAVLVNDIVVNEKVLINGALNTTASATFRTWQPVGTSDKPYAGTFDGQGYTISGLYSTQSEEYFGFFRYNSGTIKNLHLKDTYFSIGADGYGYVGGICANNTGTITNCSVAGYLYSDGSSNDTTVAGGICAVNSNKITYCRNEAYILSDMRNDISHSGGICGNNSGTIEYCYNMGEVVAKASAGGDDAANAYAGGIACSNTGTVRYCFNAGKVTCSGGANTRDTVVVYAGGICGSSSKTVEKCFNNGAVSASANSSASDQWNAAKAYAGGIVSKTSSGAVIRNCKSIGTLSATAYATGGNDEALKDAVCPLHSGTTTTTTTYTSTHFTDGTICGVLTYHPEKVQGTTATCVDAGETTYVCCACGKTRVEAGIATGLHTYDDACDEDCNVCGGVRTAPHRYEQVCDAECNVCGVVREVTHTYSGVCDTDCDVCGAVRETSAHTYVSEVTKEATCGATGMIVHTCTVCGNVYKETIPATGNHVYTNNCDNKCNACSQTRWSSDMPHERDGGCDKYCNYCGDELYSSEPHTYDHADDNYCNVCGEYRTIPEHVYDDACDATCNTCGEVRLTIHNYSDVCDTDCNVCGWHREAPHGFENACDEECGVCGICRDVPAHIYSNACDTDCNVCDAVREVNEHVYDGDSDPYCNLCGSINPVSTTGRNIIASSTNYSLKWTLDDQGLLIIESTTIPARAAENYLSEYIHLIRSVKNAYGTTSVGEYAFAGCTALTSVELGSISTIGAYAFEGCTSLTTVHLRDTSTVSAYAFAGCTALKSVFFDDVDTVGNYAFSGCTALEWVAFAESGGLGSAVFSGCTALRSIYLYTYSTYGDSNYNSASLTAVADSFKGLTATVYYPPFDEPSYWLKQVAEGKYGGTMSVAPSWSAPCGPNAFGDYDAATQTLTIRGTGTLLGGVFSGEYTWWYVQRNVVKHLIIEDGITTIPAYCFEYYKWLETVRLPNTLTSLSCNAFNNCKRITSIVLPASLKSIYHGFHRCESLKDIYYMGTEQDWEKVSVSTMYDANGDVTMYGETLHFLTYVPEFSACVGEGNEEYFCFADGYGMFDGQKQPIDAVPSTPAVGHAYDHACDVDCNTCGDLREVEPHVYDNACDTTCNVCGAVREVGDHVYDYDCDATCNECGARREAEHVYFTDCDRVCEICGEETRDVHHTVTRVAAVAATCVDNGNIEYWYCSVCGMAWLDADCTLNTNLKAVILPATGIHTYDNACDTDCNVCGAVREVGDHVYTNVCDRDCNECYAVRVAPHEYDAVCDEYCNLCSAKRKAEPHLYDNACDPECDVCGVLREPQHTVWHVSAVAATCVENGNIEYWYCSVCGMAWLDAECIRNTNLKAVILPALGGHTYNNACDANCNVCGGVREVPDHVYDYVCDATCNECGALRDAKHVYDNACDADCNVCGQNRDTSHHLIHVDFKEPTCVANGNIEYWYCSVCGVAWLDAECTLNTNPKAVMLPATGIHTYDNACDAACNICGGAREVPDHVYSNDQDATCNECGYVRIAIGDVNADGRINNHDLAQLIRYVNEWDVTVDRTAADMDGNGRINNFDLGWLCRYLNGWDITPN